MAARICTLIGLLAVAAALGVVDGSPTKLPDVALGSVVLLQLERLAIAIAVLAFVATIIVRALAGDLPIKFGSTGVEYAGQAATDLQQRVALLERGLTPGTLGAGGHAAADGMPSAAHRSAPTRPETPTAPRDPNESRG